MKKLLTIAILLTMMLAMFSVSFADTIQVGDGIATSQYLPIHGQRNFSYSQQIYTQAQINHSGDINRIKFYYCRGDIAPNQDWVIYLGHTSKTSFASNTDWEPLANLTQVYNGNVSSLVPDTGYQPGAWMEITLDIPFNYNNTDNLIVAVDENNAGAGYMYWGAFENTPNTGMYVSTPAASLNPDPASPRPATARVSKINKIQFVFPNTAAPLAPTLLSPVDGGGSFADCKLTWGPTTGGADATNYDVYFGTSPTPPLVSDGQTATSYTTTLTIGNTYYWNVVAHNEIGASPASSTWSIITTQGLSIGDGIIAQKNPLGSYNGYERNAALYTADEIGAQNTRISSVLWYTNTGTTAAVPTKIYLQNTTATALTEDTWDNVISDATLLYDQTQTGLADGGFNWFLLDSPFDVDMGQNLMILVERNFGGNGAGIPGGGQAGGDIYSTEVPGTNLLWSSDNEPPTYAGSAWNVKRPNVTLAYSTYTIDTAPNPATLISPADGAIDMMPTVTLDWRSGGGGPTGYKLYLGTDNPPTNTANGMDMGNVNTYNITGLSRGNTYYWQIVPYNAIGSTLATACPVRSFSTFPEGLAVIGDGTETDLHLPLNTDYYYNYSQTLYLQDEIQIPGQRIEKLYYYWNGLDTGRYIKDWTIYMGHTEKSAFDSDSDWVPFGDLGQVFSGEVDIPASEGWIEITLHMPFAYDNLSNLVIAVNETTPGAADYRSRFLGTSSAEHRGLRLQEDVICNPASPDSGILVAGIANIKLQLEDPPTGPLLSVIPNTWDFNTQIFNTVTPKEFTIRNTGVAPLTINSVSVSGTGFALAEPITTGPLSTGESINFTVNYAPLAVGTYTGAINITSNAGSAQIPLNGEAIDVTIHQADLPYFEGFETVTVPALPLGWTVINNDNDSGMYYDLKWETSDEYSRTGNNSARLYTFVEEYNDDYLITPPIELTGNQRLKFWARADYHREPEEISILLSTTTPALEAFTSVVMPSTPVDLETYTEFIVDLSAYTGICYLSFTRRDDPPTGNALCLDDITIEDIQPIPPEQVSLTRPDDNSYAMLNSILQWIPSATGEPVNSYKVYLNTTGIFGENDIVYEGRDLKYQASTVKGEEYFWKVAAVGSFGATDSETRSFKTPGRYQLAESFEGTFPPAGWSTENWWYGYEHSSSYPTFAYHGTKSAHSYTGTTLNRLITPALEHLTGSTVSFQTYVAESTTQRMQLSYQDGTAWTDVGPELVLVPGAWQSHVVDLSSIAGNSYKLGFGAYFASEGSSEYIYLDHVIGPEMDVLLPSAVTLGDPAPLAVDLHVKPTLNWTATPTGGIPLEYKVYVGLTNTFTEDDLVATVPASPYTLTTRLEYDTPYYWQIVAHNRAGDSIDNSYRRFTTKEDPTIRNFPFVESFENGNTEYSSNIKDWVQITGPTYNNNYWTASSYDTPRTGQWILSLYREGQSCLTRPMELTAGTAYSVELYTRQDREENASIQVKYGTDDSLADMNLTIIPETEVIDGAYQRLYGAFSPETTGIYYLGIQGYIGRYTSYLYIDDITISELPPEPVFSYSPTEIIFGTVTQNEQTGPENVTITNHAGGILTIAETDLSIIGTNAAEFSFGSGNLPAALSAGQSVVIPVYVNTATEGAISATLRIVNNQTRTNYDVDLSANGLPEGIVVIGNGSYDLDLPIGPRYNYSYSQSIYLQSQIDVADKRIEKVYYQWNGAAEATASNDWTIYIGHTALTEFATENSWVSLDDLNQVFQGEVALPAVAGWIEIPLQIAFEYNNIDNLVIAVRENEEDCDGNNESFLSTIASTNRSIYESTDYYSIDPANPPTGSPIIAYPNVMLAFGELVADPPGPVTLLSPQDGATGLPMYGFNLTWAPTQGGYPDYYAVYMSQNAADPTDDHFWDGITLNRFDPTQAASNPITYNYSETWYWTVQALNSWGDVIQETASSFTIRDDPRVLRLPYSENFEAALVPDLPLEWTAYISSTNPDADVKTVSDEDGGWYAYAQSHPNAAELYGGYHDEADLRLITPDILVPMNSIKLKFAAKREQGWGAPSILLVGTVDALGESGTFTQLASLEINQNYETYTVSFAGYTGTDQHICFKHGLDYNSRRIYIDDIYMEELVPADLAVTAFSGDSFGLAEGDLSYNVSVFNNGTAGQSSYSVQLLNMPDHTILTSIDVTDPLASGATAEHTVIWTPALANAYNVYAKVVLAGDVNSYNDESDPMAVEVYTSTSHISIIGNFDATNPGTSHELPFCMYYNSSLSETIYMADEMQIGSGTINVIMYQNNFTQDLTLPVKIWMAHTSESQNNAWLPFDDYTLVFEGDVHFPIGKNTFAIPLQTPFQYTGGNLAVRTNRVFTSRDYEYNNQFLCTLEWGHPNRTRYLTSYYDTIDPANPSGYSSQISYIPNTKFVVNPYNAFVLSAPVVQIELSGSNPRLSWEAVDGAASYVIYGSNNPYDWDEATEIAITTNLYYNLTAASAMKFYRVVARSLGRQIRESGQNMSPAAVIGSDNSAVKTKPVILHRNKKN